MPRLFHRQPAEVPKLHNLHPPRIHPRQCGQRVVERTQLRAEIGGRGGQAIEVDLPGSIGLVARWSLRRVPAGHERTDLWILPLAGRGTKPFPFVEDRFPERNAVFSPDGRFIAYDASESSPDLRAPSADRQQVFVQPFPPTGARFQISRDGGTLPRWSRNGELFFQAPDGTMMSTSIKTSSSFEFTTPKPLFRIELTDSFAVTNDGQRFLVKVPEEAETAPLTVVVNWSRL